MLQGARVRLRPFMEADLEERYRRHADLSIRGEFYPLNLRSEATFRADFAKDGFWGSEHGVMAVVDEEGSVVGTVGFEQVVGDVDEVNLAYLIYPEYRGRGYVSEALRLFARYLFATRPGMNRARLDIHPDNANSIRVAERCGFTLEGRIREGWFNRGRWQDVLVYGLLRSELDGIEADASSARRETPVAGTV
jgi:[ribosomal protein S5]-alanine N-acetyltransferase